MILCVLHSAVPQTISRTPWNVDSTLQSCRHVAYIFPSTRDTDCAAGSKVMICGPRARMPPGICLTQGTALPFARTGATIYYMIYYLL